MKIAISISLSEELLDKIDFERQLVPRSAYVEFLLKKLFVKEVSNEE
jgi:metal-responsive CopG/Arc/MetJ family transcriptional regulator